MSYSLDGVSYCPIRNDLFSRVQVADFSHVQYLEPQLSDDETQRNGSVY
jgi:hypothetical protein